MFCRFPTSSAEFASSFAKLIALVIGALISLQLLFVAETKGAWMKAANYDNPVTRQQHFDLGLSYAGMVVHTMWDSTWRGSGVVGNNPRCIIMSAHQFENAGVFLDPAVQNLYVRSGTNYLNNPGTSVRISQIIRHPTRTAPGVRTDSVIAILESDLPGAIPAAIAVARPTVNDVLDIIGFGNQGKAWIGGWGYIIPTSGDIIGGKAPVYALDGVQIQTKFLANSAQPLIFNATPGDSGGGLLNAQRQLCGNLSNITGPTNNCSTYSVDLISISSWIEQVTSPYNVDPTLHIQHVAGQIVVKVTGAPILHATGTWTLERSTGLEDWDVSDEQFTGNTCVISPTEAREFYRLRFVPSPPAALAVQAAETRKAEEALKRVSRIVLPKINNLLLPRSQ